ncbi:hypothetical protein [Pararhodobacter marinus]|uniref:hypothetical protein n=1 Tax=Pararhodobacter marinus TaxID=2184063 RepID=UPI003511BF2F
MTKSKLLILGNSHSEALPRDPIDGYDLEIHWLKTKDNAKFGTMTLPEAREKVASLTANDTLVLMHLGALHNIYGLLNHDVPYGVLLDDGARVGPEDAQIIPVSSIRAVFQNKFESDKVVPAIKEATRAQVVHVMPPPPKEEIPERFRNKGGDYHGRGIAEFGFAPADLRLALWRIEESALSSFLGKLGIMHYAAPAETLTATGFLAPDFYANDATHANAAFGKQLMDAIVRLSKSRAYI